MPWQNQTAAQFVRRFLYQTLLTSDADAAVEVSLRRRGLLRDLTRFSGIAPSYWIQLRVAGRGIRVAEQLINELFDEIGLRSEEWLGVAGSSARLGIFGSFHAPKLKMVFSIESTPYIQKCDLLLPVTDGQAPPDSHEACQKPTLRYFNGQIIAPSFFPNTLDLACRQHK